MGFQTPAIPRYATLHFCAAVPEIPVLTSQKTNETFSSTVEVKISGVNHTPHTRILTEALYLSLYLLLNWSGHFQLSARNPGLLRKNLDQLSKMSAELRRGIPEEREFRDGEHGLTLILLEITVGGGRWKKGWPSKKGALYGD